MESITLTPKPEPKKIGGWLILVALGLLISPLRLCMSLVMTFPPIIIDGTWQTMTTQGSEFYSPLWIPLLIGELVFNLGIFMISLYLVYLFFNKKKDFPDWYAGLAIISFVFILVDAFLVTMIMPEIPMFDYETITALIPTLGSLLIWTPYLFLSKRSKDTFIL
ncbi:MAG: DUF2569 domain-containing protein [Chloroflexota bacterium]|nr:MAG: DUF2569 domain-containing protein [Chloroflexota bacterium]